MKKNISVLALAALVLTGCSTPGASSAPAAAAAANAASSQSTGAASGAAAAAGPVTPAETCATVTKALKSVSGQPDSPQHWAALADQLRPLAQGQKAAPSMKADVQGAEVYASIRAKTWTPQDVWEKNPANQAVANMGTRAMKNLESKCVPTNK